MNAPTPIFGAYARPYWEAGLQVMPLHTRSKRPMFNDWNKWAETKVTPEDITQWEQSHPNANMGLVLGRASGLCMIDIDTDDAKVFNAIRSVLPHSPWERKGRKGLMLAFRVSNLKTFRIKNASGETIVEMLSHRTQCVLPPSIHPDTNLPYVANVNLYDVLQNVVALPDNIEELLRLEILEAICTPEQRQQFQAQLKEFAEK